MQLFDLAHSLLDNAVTTVADEHFNDLFTPAGFLNELFRLSTGSFASS